MEKKNLGSILALYPTPVTIIGAMVEGKPNWMLVAHVGIIVARLSRPKSINF